MLPTSISDEASAPGNCLALPAGAQVLVWPPGRIRDAILIEPTTSPGRAPSPLLLLVPVAAFFSPMLFFGRALYLRDTATYFAPHKALIGRALHQGRIPQWNPLSYGGSPLLVDPNFNAFHPLSLLTDVWPTPFGYAAFAAVNALLAALGTWVLARRLGLARDASLVAAIGYGWSGTFVSLVEGGQFVAPSALPWILAASVLLAQAPSTRSFVFAVLAGAVTIVSGTPEIGACGFALGGLLTLVEARGSRGRALALFAGAVGFALALAAVQVVPTLLFMRQSSRAAGWTFSEATDYSLHPLRLPGLLFPFFAGDANAAGGPYWIDHPDLQHPYIPELYSGLVLLVLAGVGMVTNRSRALMAAAGASAVLMLGSFGRHTPIYELMWRLLPPLRSIRFPEKFFVPAALVIALLAGAGWTAVWTQGPRRWRIASIGAGLALVACAGAIAALDGRLDSLLGPERAACLRDTFLPSVIIELGLLCAGAAAIAARWPLFLGLLVVVELAWPAVRMNESIPSVEMTQPPPSVDLLQRDSSGVPNSSWRFDTESRARPADIEGAGDRSWSRTHKLFSLRHAALYGTQPALFGLHQIRGYSGFTSGAMKSLFGSKRPRAIMDFLGVRYGLEYGSSTGSTYQRLGFDLLPPAPGSLVRIWKNPAAARKLRFTDAILASTREGLLAVCGTRPAVWLSAADREQLPSGLPAADGCAQLAPGATEGAEATIVRYEPELVEASVEAPGPGLLVLNDAADPGWRVTVDGAAAAPVAAGGALRAVWVPAGRHEVRWTYSTPGLCAGAAVSALAALGLILLAVKSAVGRPRGESAGRG